MKNFAFLLLILFSCNQSDMEPNQLDPEESNILMIQNIATISEGVAIEIIKSGGEQGNSSIIILSNLPASANSPQNEEEMYLLRGASKVIANAKGKTMYGYELVPGRYAVVLSYSYPDVSPTGVLRPQRGFMTTHLFEVLPGQRTDLRFDFVIIDQMTENGMTYINFN